MLIYDNSIFQSDADLIVLPVDINGDNAPGSPGDLSTTELPEDYTERYVKWIIRNEDMLDRTHGKYDVPVFHYYWSSMNHRKAQWVISVRHSKDISDMMEQLRDLWKIILQTGAKSVAVTSTGTKVSWEDQFRLYSMFSRMKFANAGVELQIFTPEDEDEEITGNEVDEGTVKILV